MCMFCWFTRVGVNVYALLILPKWGECVCLIDLPEMG